MSSSRWTRPHIQRRELRPKRPRRSLIASSSDFDTTSAQVVRPSNRPSSPSSQRSISDGVSRPTRFPGYWKTGWERSTPARMRQALPQIGAQRVLGETGHERLVDGRLDAVRVHDRVPLREAMARRLGGRVGAVHRAQQPDHLARRRADQVHLSARHVRQVDDALGRAARRCAARGTPTCSRCRCRTGSCRRRCGCWR